jgi:hypothetical protein
MLPPNDEFEAASQLSLLSFANAPITAHAEANRNRSIRVAFSTLHITVNGSEKVGR